jgi:type II secretory pathway component PulF
MFYLFAPLTLGVEFIAAWIYVWLRWRRLRTNAVTNSLSLLVGQNLPLVEGLRAVAHGERGATSSILKDIATRLSFGESVATAVRGAHPTIPGDVLGAIQAGEAAGTLPTVLRGIDQRVRERTIRSMGATPSLIYVVLLAMFLILHVFVITTFLVPKFRDIFADFGVRELPWATEILVSFAGNLRGDLGGLWWLLWLAVLTVIGQIVIGRYFIVRVPDRVQPLFRVMDALFWYFPGARRIAQTRALARQLPLLTASVRAGHDLPAAALHAACTDANWFARRRLLRWSKLMLEGMTPAEAARQVNLPGPLRRFAATSRSSDELLAELSYLAAYYERLMFHWERIAAACVTPVLVLTVSVVVGLVVISLYLPMRSLLNAVMAEVY